MNEEVSAIPPASLGTSIGSIDDSSGSWVFTPAPSSTGSYQAPDSIVSCANASTNPVWVRLEYQYVDRNGDEQTTFQVGRFTSSGGPCFLVVDIAPATVDVYVSTNGSQSDPGEDDWGDRLNAEDIVVSGRPVPTGSTITLVDDPSTGYVAGPTAAVLTANDGGSVTVVNGSSADTIQVWVNRTGSKQTIAKGQSQALSFDDAKWQWTLGFANQDDPQIVIKRPPYRTE